MMRHFRESAARLLSTLSAIPDGSWWGVIPYSTFTHGMVNIRYFIMVLMLLMAMMLVIINRVVSVRISRPILKLNNSVMEYEAGEKPEIYMGGPLEIRHLGYSIRGPMSRLRR